MTTNIFIL